MITEYGCVQCQKWHRKGMDAEYDQHIVFQSKHGVRERMPLPGEIEMSFRCLECNAFIGNEADLRSHKCPPPLPPSPLKVARLEQAITKATTEAEYAQKQLAYAMSHTTNQSVATLEAMNRAADALERVLESLRSAKYFCRIDAMNARLIAAAPDLLEACKASLAVMKGSSYGGAPGTIDAVALLEAAIAKAVPSA